MRFFWERWKGYFQIEQYAVIRLPFLLFSMNNLTMGLAFYIGGMVKAPLAIYAFMILFYMRFPTLRSLKSIQTVS